MTRDRSDLRLALIRYQAALFLFLALAPLAVAALLLGGSSSTNLTTGIGFPLLGDGKIPTWLLPCIYIAVITGPLLSWSHADIEVGAGRFERLSFPAPHLLASGLAVVTLFAVSSGPTRADALFWVAASMAIANLSAILVQTACVGRGLAEHVRGAEPAPPGPATTSGATPSKPEPPRSSGWCLPWSTSSGNATTCCIAEKCGWVLITRDRPSWRLPTAGEDSVATRPDRSPRSSREPHTRRPGRGRLPELELGSSGGIPASRQRAGKTPPECEPPDLSGSRSRPSPRCWAWSPSAWAPAPAPTRGPPRPAQRGPHNENYDPPVYPPTGRTVYQGTPGNPLVRPWGVYQGLAEQAWMPYLGASAEPEGPARQDHPAAEGDLVRPLAARLRHPATASRSTSS